MAVLKVENFGGVMPSVSPRALSPDAAQVNNNLFLATREFRPLASDTTVTTGLTNAKTLYRIDSSTAWITSTNELSYARGQINGDTTKRTYYSNNTTATNLRTFDSGGNDRILGVPAPASLSVTTTQGAFFTADTLINAVQKSIAGSMALVEPNIRYTGTTTVAGPLTVPALHFPTDAVNLPTQVRNQNAYWNLYAKIAITRIDALNINLPDISYAYADATWAYIPIMALPFGYIENGVLMSTSLAQIINPRTSAQALTTAQIDEIRQDVYDAFNASKNAYSLRTELTEIVREFHALLTGYPAATATVPGSGPTSPLGPGPTVPTVEQWIIELGNESSSMAPEWETYYEQLGQYINNLAIYNANQTVAETDNRSATERISELQARAWSITKAIEAIQVSIWQEIVEDIDWVAERINKNIAAGDITNLDAPRVIQTRFYLVTFVNDRDEESAPSPPSAQQNVDQFSSTVVSRPTAPAGGYASRNISYWRVYRSNSTADQTTFQFVAEVAIGASTHSDTLSNEALGEIIPTVGWAEPELGLKGLVAMPNGIMAAFKDNTIHFCEPYAPYAFPASYQITTEFPIVGLGVFGQTLFVGTTGNPYLISGSDSASMSSIKLESNQSCVSRRSIATVPGGVIYASPDGLCMVTSSGVQVVTRALFTREDWQALVPSSILGIAHEDIYYFFYDTGAVRGCYAFDLVSTKLGIVAGFTNVTAIYVDREADEFYANDASSIKRLFSTSRRVATWRSPLITLPAQTHMAWLKVYGGQTVGLPVTVRWYGDGVLRHTATISSVNPVRLPAGRWLEHEIEIESASRVTKVLLASSTQELQGV